MHYKIMSVNHNKDPMHMQCFTNNVKWFSVELRGFTDKTRDWKSTVKIVFLLFKKIQSQRTTLEIYVLTRSIEAFYYWLLRDVNRKELSVWVLSEQKASINTVPSKITHLREALYFWREQIYNGQADITNKPS